MARHDSESIQARRPPLLHLLARLAVSSAGGDDYLSAAWIPRLLAALPTGRRRVAALRLLALSPHSFIYQWSDLHGDGLSRSKVLEKEWLRNADSRREICEELLKPRLVEGMDVLDFGCGPGWLAQEVASRVASVTGCDLSAGVIACANVLSPVDNLEFIVNDPQGLPAEFEDRFDLVYSFAVFQHVHKPQVGPLLREFRRVLKEGGRVLLHTILGDPEESYEPLESARGLRRRLSLRGVLYTVEEWQEAGLAAGFESVEVQPVSEIADIDDDIGRQHLVLLG